MLTHKQLRTQSEEIRKEYFGLDKISKYISYNNLQLSPHMKSWPLPYIYSLSGFESENKNEVG